MVNVSTSLINSKTQVDNLDVAELKTALIGSKKLTDVVKNEVVKITKFTTSK